MVYSISYDLRKPGTNYIGLYEAIKTIGAWASPMDSYWLVDTDLTAGQIFDRLRVHMDENDLMLVAGITQDYKGFLPNEIWSWLKSRTLFPA